MLGAVAGVKKKQAWYESAKELLKSVQEVRHFLQHFDREMGKLVKGTFPIGGCVIASFPGAETTYARVLSSTPARYREFRY